MDSSYYWEELTGKWHIQNSLHNARESHFLHYTFTVFCMLNYYNNQLVFLGKNFLHLSLSVSIIYISIRDGFRELHMHTSSCKINKLKEI